MTTPKKKTTNRTPKKRSVKRSSAKKSFNPKSVDPNKAQRLASDPKTSVWLSANAGTGKTKVLTDRVLRLMLDGNEPEDILCVTFTTAAAALMQRRIRAELSSWTTCTDYMLDKKLKELVGRKPDATLRNHARQLFARFLEAPEGIKIQTIHALSQKLIEKFPIESGVPPSFTVMDAEDAAAMVRTAQADVLNRVQDEPNSELAHAVRLITPEVGEAEFVTLIQEIVTNREQFHKMIEGHGGLENTINAVYEYLEADHSVSGSDLRFMMGDEEAGDLGLVPDMAALRQAASILEEGSSTDQERAHIMNLWLDAEPDQRNLMFKEYVGVFLTDKHTVRKRLTTKASAAALDIMEAEAERLTQVLEAMKTANVARGTEALLVLSHAVLEAYDTRKKARNALDYDDLIHKAGRLMQEKDTSWVLGKIPGDLKHVLVDEAQDTSPHQWDIVEGILTAFINGDKSKGAKKRTMFVVGDEKQSIFSFQGADPVEFARRKGVFEKLVKKSGGKWRDVSMDITFRSAPVILEAVDAVFKDEKVSKGVRTDTKKALSHTSFRQGHSGIVEVSPVVKGTKAQDIEPWTWATDMEFFDDSAIEQAEAIAARIQGWLEDKEQLPARGRAIQAGDIMILVRRRSGFVDHVVRALKRRNVPVSGVDRMMLNDQIAVKDLLALGEALLDPRDDYKLAVTLKTPLINMTEKQLESLALGRKGTLWQELERRAQSGTKRNAPYKKVYDYLVDLKQKMHTEGVYTFYSNIMMTPCPAHPRTGLTAIYKRLGGEAEDPIVEFMNAVERFEKQHPSNLQPFLHWIEQGEAEVKREINHATDVPKVQIRTVHGAKGLESPIVILPDTTGIPSDNQRARPRLLWPNGDRDVPLWVPHTDLENKAFREEKAKVEAAMEEEYRRLLYVAMTRAEDRLYIYGHQNGQRIRDNSWHSMVSQGIAQHMQDHPHIQIDMDEDEQVYIHCETPQKAKPNDDGIAPPRAGRRIAIPDWAIDPLDDADEITTKKRFRPSSVYNEQAKKPGNDNMRVNPSPLSEEGDDSYRFKQGNLVHQLLEFLPSVPKDRREQTAMSYLSDRIHGLKAHQQTRVWQQVDAVLHNPEFDFIFGEGSRPEVNISGEIDVKGEIQDLNGQIDRLVVTDDQIWIVDYKSNAKIPDGQGDIRPDYIAQMAAYRYVIQQLYPDKDIKTAFLWTRANRLDVVDDARLDKAAKDIGLKPIAGPKRKAPAAKHRPAPKR